MKVDLSQEYKDNLYEKVLEKKKQRTKTRKVLLNTYLVYVSVVGIASYGFSKLSKGDYNNFFVSKTDNIEFNDEYEYFDDLGIKLEFINKDENSLTIGINIKYDNIKNYDVNIENFCVGNVKMLIYEAKSDIELKSGYQLLKDVRVNSKDDITYFIILKKKNIVNFEDVVIKIKDITFMNDKSFRQYNINWEKEKSIE